MTLKENFNKISCSDCDMPYCDIHCTRLSEYELNHLEKVANEFAIEFAEWSIAKNMGVNKFTLYEGELEQFKKEKGL